LARLDKRPSGGEILKIGAAKESNQKWIRVNRIPWLPLFSVILRCEQSEPRRMSRHGPRPSRAALSHGHLRTTVKQ
jgi:hypothetical protein